MLVHWHGDRVLDGTRKVNDLSHDVGLFSAPDLQATVDDLHGTATMFCLDHEDALWPNSDGVDIAATATQPPVVKRDEPERLQSVEALSDATLTFGTSAPVDDFVRLFHCQPQEREGRQQPRQTSDAQVARYQQSHICGAECQENAYATKEGHSSKESLRSGRSFTLICSLGRLAGSRGAWCHI